MVGRRFRWDRRRSRPATWVPARLRAGARLSPEKAGRKSAGGKPPGPPSFMARSFPLAGFGVVGRSGMVVRLLRGPCTCPDLGRFFRIGLHNPEASPWGEAVTEGDGCGGDRVAQRGRRSIPLGRQPEALFFCFYKERLGTGSPPHPTRLRRATFPPRGRLWRWERSRAVVGRLRGLSKCSPAYFFRKMRPKSVLAYRRK